MKIGSLIELIDDNWDQNLKDFHYSNGAVYPIKNKIYTVRDVYVFGYAVRLEEIVNPVITHLDGDGEPAFKMRRFRELMPPMELKMEALIHETI